MSDQFWPTKAQLKRIEPFFPRTSGIPRGRPACGQRDSPCDLEWSAMAGCARGLWPHNTLYNRFVRWSRMGIFDRIVANLAAESGPPDRVMIDSTHLRRIERPQVCSKKGDSPRLIRHTKCGLNSQLHAVCDGAGRPVILLLTEGQTSDHKGAALIYPMLPDRRTRHHVSHTFFSAICIVATVIFWLGQ
jgi:transposase